jgi:transcriptional regulator with XRE-family HTH domain
MSHHRYMAWHLTLCGIKGKISPNIRQRQRRVTLEALRRARADTGLTISELAKRAGVSRDTVSNAERGLHSLQATTLHKVAHALGKAPSELLAEEERLTPKARSSSPEPALFNGPEEERRTVELSGTIEGGGSLEGELTVGAVLLSFKQGEISLDEAERRIEQICAA